MSGQIVLPEKGYYEIWARATDSEGNRQPILGPGWNSKGYLNNACHRIAVRAVRDTANNGWEPFRSSPGLGYLFAKADRTTE